MTMLTDRQLDMMAHCIGHHSAKGCSVHGGQNYYVTASDDLDWCVLVIRGLAVERRSSIIGRGESVFSLTRSGVMAVESDPRSRRPPSKGRRYAVRFRGLEHPIEVMAGTRGQARASASIDLAEVWNIPTFDAIRRVTSCVLS